MGLRVDHFRIDLRIGKDYLPVASSIMEIDWKPDLGQFRLADSAIQIGQSKARISAGIFAMGPDRFHGPTIGISLRATDGATAERHEQRPTAVSAMTFPAGLRHSMARLA